MDIEPSTGIDQRCIEWHVFTYLLTVDATIVARLQRQGHAVDGQPAKRRAHWERPASRPDRTIAPRQIAQTCYPPSPTRRCSHYARYPVIGRAPIIPQRPDVVVEEQLVGKERIPALPTHTAAQPVGGDREAGIVHVHHHEIARAGTFRAGPHLVQQPVANGRKPDGAARAFTVDSIEAEDGPPRCRHRPGAQDRLAAIGRIVFRDDEMRCLKQGGQPGPALECAGEVAGGVFHGPHEDGRAE